jgi:Xaa-Pro aminopeptidase
VSRRVLITTSDPILRTMIGNDEAIVMAGVPATNMLLFHRIRFRVGDPVALMEWGAGSGARARTLILRDIEMDRARAHARADAFACPRDFEPAGGLSGDRETATAQALAECLRRAGARKAVSDRTFPAIFAHHLMLAGISLRCEPSLFITDRRAKDEAEIAAMRASQAMTERAIELACRMIARASAGADGTLSHAGATLTSERVRGEIDAFLARAGFDNPRSIVAGGPQGGDCHHDGTGPLRTGEPVIIDIFPRSKATGYWGDSTRCVVHGTVPPEVARMHATVIRAKAAATAAVRAGVTGETVHAATRAVIEAAGFGMGLPPAGAPPEWCGMVHGTGHGLGLDVHEPPLLDRGGPELVTGDVITIEPGLYSHAIGGIRIEDAVTVTPHGAVNLGTGLSEGLDWS